MSFSAIVQLSAVAEACCAMVAPSAGHQKLVFDGQHPGQDSATFFEIALETTIGSSSKRSVDEEPPHSVDETNDAIEESDVLGKTETVKPGEEVWAEKISLEARSATGAACNGGGDDGFLVSAVKGGKAPEADKAPTLIDGVTSSAPNTLGVSPASDADINRPTRLSAGVAWSAHSSESDVFEGDQLSGEGPRGSKQIDETMGIVGIAKPAEEGTGNLGLSKANSQRIVPQSGDATRSRVDASKGAEIGIQREGLEALGKMMPRSGTTERGFSGSPANEQGAQPARHIQVATQLAERLAKADSVLKGESTERPSHKTFGEVSASESAHSHVTRGAFYLVQTRSAAHAGSYSYCTEQPFGALADSGSAETVNALKSELNGFELPKVNFKGEGMKPHGLDWTQASHARGLGADYATAILRKATSRIAQDNTQYLELVLQPKDLGKLKFFVTMNESGMTVHVDADRPTTLDALRRHAESFALDLSGDGFENVAFSFGTGEQQDKMRSEQSADLVVLEVVPEELAGQPEMPQGTPLGRLDMRI